MHDCFQNRKTSYSTGCGLCTVLSFIYHLKTGKIITVQNKLQLFFLIKNLKIFPFYPVAVGKYILANLAVLEHRDLFLLSVCCSLKNHM